MRTSRGDRSTGRKPSVRRILGSPVVAATLFAAAALALPLTPLAAQTRPSAAHVEVSLGATTIHGDFSGLTSGTVLLGITGRVALGGAAHVVLGTRALAGSTPDSDTELRVAYGGFVTHVLLSDTPRHALWLRVLAGAGNAKVDLTLVRTRIAADNFGVLAPEVGGTVRLAGPLHLGAALGYRATFGVEDLPGVTPGDLRGPTGRLLLSARVF